MRREADGDHGVVAPGSAPARATGPVGDAAELWPHPRRGSSLPHGPFGTVGEKATIRRRSRGPIQAWRGIAPSSTCSTSCMSARSPPTARTRRPSAGCRYLADVGITTLELMPIADFAGGHNWGYRRRQPLPPTRNYGTPDEPRRFVDRAHACGLAVISDVVDNDFGRAAERDGRVVAVYKSDQVTDSATRSTSMGPEAGPVLRATSSATPRTGSASFTSTAAHRRARSRSTDRSDDDVLAAIAQARARGRRRRRTSSPARTSPGHGAARAADRARRDLGRRLSPRGRSRSAATGRRTSPTTSGPRRSWSRPSTTRSTRASTTPGRRSRAVVAAAHARRADDLLPREPRSGREPRLRRAPARHRRRGAAARDHGAVAVAAELPMLFQGQETGSRRRRCTSSSITTRICSRRCATARRGGRAVPATATPEAQRRIVDPCDAATFRSGRPRARAALARQPDGVALPRSAEASPPRSRVPTFDELDGAVLGDDVLAIRYFAVEDRLLLFNLGRRSTSTCSPSRCSAAARHRMACAVVERGSDLRWPGTPDPFGEGSVADPTHAAIVLAPDPALEAPEG